MQVLDRGDRIIVRVSPGERLHADTPAANQLLALAKEAKGCVVHVDARQMTVIAAGCIGTLLRAQTILRGAGCRLVIVQPPGRIEEVFDVTRVNRVLDIEPAPDRDRSMGTPT